MNIQPSTLETLLTVAKRQWDAAMVALANVQRKLTEHDAYVQQLDELMKDGEERLEIPSVVSVAFFQYGRAHLRTIQDRKQQLQVLRKRLEGEVSDARALVREKYIAHEKWKLVEKKQKEQERKKENRREQKELDDINSTKAARRKSVFD